MSAPSTAVLDKPTRPPTPGARPGLAARASVEAFVAQLARAVQRFHAYPPANPLCAEAASAAHQALLAVQGRDHVQLRVSLGGLLLDDEPLKGQAALLADFVRRLRKAGLASVTIDREASSRDLTRFCRELAARTDVPSAGDTFADVLAVSGIEKVQVTTLHEPEVLDVPTPSDARLSILAHEQARRETLIEENGPAGHLYPPDKGWVRVDPSCRLQRVNVADLPLLVDDPLALARLLSQLAEDPGDLEAADLLTDHFEEITGLIASLDPAIVESLFARLARSVLALEPQRRQKLLRETVLPGLLEGRVDGQVLRHFPDVDLAESLALLLDLQVAAPELLSFALDRLDLPEERREAVQPLVADQVAARTAEETAAPEAALAPGAIDGLVEGQIHVGHGEAKDFSEFAAYDLAIDDALRARFAAMTHDIGATDTTVERIRCALNLVTLEFNPQSAESLLSHAVTWLDEVRARPDWATFADWTAEATAVASRLRDERPEVAECIDAAVARLVTPQLVNALVDYAESGNKAMARTVLARCGRSLVPAIISTLETEPARTRRHALVNLLSAEAAALAPALVPHLEHPQWFVVRNLVLVLGHAGAGAEAAVGGRLEHPEVRVVREALRALARIGTSASAARVASALEAKQTQSMAEDALWRFPGEVAVQAAGELLARADFVRREPALARRLLARAADEDFTAVADVARQLVRFRYHFWRPALSRVGALAASLSRTA